MPGGYFDPFGQWIPAATGYAQVHASTSAQTFANGTEALVQFDTVDSDVEGMFSAGANTRLTIQRAGKYLVTGRAIWALSSAGRVYINLWKNGLGGTFIGESGDQTGTAGIQSLTISLVVDCAAGDYLGMGAFQGCVTSGSLFTATGIYPTLQVERLGD